MEEIRPAAASRYDIRIEQIQRAEVLVPSYDDAIRWIKWLVEMGYHAFGPFKVKEGEYRIDFTQLREIVADTRRGDAVAFDGRYTCNSD